MQGPRASTRVTLSKSQVVFVLFGSPILVFASLSLSCSARGLECRDQSKVFQEFSNSGPDNLWNMNFRDIIFWLTYRYTWILESVVDKAKSCPANPWRMTVRHRVRHALWAWGKVIFRWSPMDGNGFAFKVRIYRSRPKGLFIPSKVFQSCCSWDLWLQRRQWFFVCLFDLVVPTPRKYWEREMSFPLNQNNRILKLKTLQPSLLLTLILCKGEQMKILRPKESWNQPILGQEIKPRDCGVVVFAV